METLIKYNGVNLIVEYELEGKYFPATYYEPEEMPDLIIKSIKTEDSKIDLQNILGYEKVDEIIDLIEL